MGGRLLEVRGLATEFVTAQGTARAVDDVSFAVARGEKLALIGESGAGKSLTGLSLLRLVDPPGRIVAGRAEFDGDDLLALSEAEMRHVRGRRIAMVFQDPTTALNPVLTLGTQMAEAVRAHAPVTRAEARRRAREALGLVGLPSPEALLGAYPHQLSGGMRQRVAIGIALLHRPDLIVADEPTTALDVTTQAQILALMQRLVAARDTALIWITHDLAVVAGLADRVAVMYAGRIVEVGSMDAVLRRPLHPYTAGLIDSLPERNRRGARLRQIPGAAPGPLARASGCRFRPRCFRAAPECEQEPGLVEMRPGLMARCVRPLLDEAG